MAGKKILVVDDEVMLVDLLQIRLEAGGYEVETAHDGLEGLSKAQKVHPDLIILDIGMEGMDGYTMLKELRKTVGIQDTKVIMLTASGKKRELFEKEGISDYIVKPFDTEDFLARVARILEKGKPKK
jgi:two-component system OmpR family response regulator